MYNKKLSIIITLFLCSILSISGMLTPISFFKNSSISSPYSFAKFPIPKCNASVRYPSSNNYQRNYCIMPTKDFYNICKALEKPVMQSELLTFLKNTKSNTDDLEKLYVYNNKELESSDQTLSQCKSFMRMFKTSCALATIAVPAFIYIDSFITVEQFDPLLCTIILFPIRLGAIIGGTLSFLCIPLLPIAIVNQIEIKKNLPIMQENNDLLKALMTRLKENKLLTLKEAATDYALENKLILTNNQE